MNDIHGGFHAQHISNTIRWLTQSQGKVNPLLPQFLLSAYTAYNTYTAHTANTAWGGPKGNQNT